MTKSETKIVQYLNEAHAMETGLVRVLQEQIAVTPRGRYRTALEQHLRETRDHATQIAARRQELPGSGNPLGALAGVAHDAVGQALALAKAPLDLLRGSGGEEKVLKNAKDACASEALEIATYIALEHLARSVDDTRTAELAASIRRDEDAMLARIEHELPALARAVARAEIGGEPSYEISQTGAADAVRDVAKQARPAAKRTAAKAKTTATRQTRRVPGATRAEGAAKGAVASASDLPIAGYDEMTADEIVKRLPELSQVDLTKVEVYERTSQGRSTVLDRAGTLRGDEPWAGYDDMTADEAVERLRDADDKLVAKARDYERAHKDRTTVMRAVERERTHA